MKWLLLVVFALAAACGAPCDPIPRVQYRLALVAINPDGFFCFSQAPVVDMTDDASLAASFEDGCHVTLDRACGATHLRVECSDGVNLSCTFDGAFGRCTNDLEALVCDYDAWLDPVRTGT